MRISIRNLKATVLSIPVVAACGPADSVDDSGVDTLATSIVIDPNASYTITGVHSSKCVQFAGASTANLARAQIATCNGSNAQRFSIQPLSNGYNTVRSTHSGKCLHVRSASTANGAAIVQYTCNGGTNQQWRISDVSSSVVRLIARHSGKVMDVEQAGTADGTNIVQWTWSGATNQQFRVNAVGGGSGGAGGGAGSAGAGGSAGSAGSTPRAEFVPAPTGTCPEFSEGTLTFDPRGPANDPPARAVRIWMSDAARTLDGPLVFYWHGTGSLPTEAVTGIGLPQIDAIKAQGGIVAAASADPTAGGFPWFLTNGSTRDDDLLVADEVLACAIQKLGMDQRRIHSMGFSIGGLQTTQMSYRRSGYLASVVTYSGGRVNGVSIPTQDASNKFAAMIFHGGFNDVVVISFQAASEAYAADLRSKSQFAMLCNHGANHTIPNAAARAGVWRFLQDHPFGTVPSPYASGLPSSMPTYCSL